MIKQNQRVLNAAFGVLDALVICVSLLCAWWLRFKTTLFGPIGGHLGFEQYALFLVLAVLPTYLILYFSFGLSKPFRTHKTIFNEATQIIKVNIVAFVVPISFNISNNKPDLSFE